uniref:Cytochrome c oxidase subunit 2 n=1 Tax=Olavius algarvensis TaxID=188229 RepID=A0A7R9NHU5_9ANNE|nr:COX2 CDS [Olavius algarvensis]
MSPWLQLSLQDPASSTSASLLLFHDLILITMILVMSIISYMMMFLMLSKYTNQKTKEAHKIELIWTISPALILMFLAIPSLRLLYLMDESNEPMLTLKAIGHQWYWSYEYSDFPYISYDSFMLPTKLLKNGEFRLLEVDNRLIVPMNTEIRLLVTASDVIHAWTIPALSIKADAIPGRLNQLTFTLSRAGVFYGQCSEICGANHSFMPIVLESVNMKSFINWSKSYVN